MRKKGLWAVLTALLIIVLPLGAVSAWAKETTDAPELAVENVQSVRVNDYDNFIYGGDCYPVGKIIGVWEGGKERELAADEIEYTDIQVNFISKIFESSEVSGRVKGTNVTFKQTITVVPADMVYFINAGAAADDPFHAAMKRNFGLKNETPIQQSTNGSWGWTDTYQTENKQKITGVFDTVAFPSEQSGHTNFDMTMPGFDDGTYDLYIGHYSFWHTRGVEVTVNGQKYYGEFGLAIKPLRETTLIPDIAVTDGKIDVSMNGKGFQNEAIAAFYAVVPSIPDKPALPAKPVGPESLSVSDNSFTVQGLQIGNLLLIANAENNRVILSERITEETMTVTIAPEVFATLNVLDILQMNTAGASETFQTVKTDIYDIRFVYDDAWSLDALAVDAVLTCESHVTKLEVINGREIKTFHSAVKNENEFTVPFTVEQNGNYTIKIYSSAGTVISRELQITNIERENPSVECTIDYKNSTPSRLRMGIKVDNISPLAAVKLYKDNALLREVPVTDKKFEIAEKGFYTVTVFTESGHKSVYSFHVTFEGDLGQTARIAFSTTKRPARDLSIGFSAIDGYELGSVTVSGVMANGKVERMIVNKGNMPVYENGNYYATLVSSDGSREIMVFTVNNISAAAQKEGLHWGFGVLIGAGTMLIIGAIVLVVLRKKIFG